MTMPTTAVYSPTTWVNDAAPSIDASHLNNIETGLSNVTNDLRTVEGIAVTTSRTVNGKALSANITLTYSDVGADASGAASTVSAASLQKSSNLTDLSSRQSALNNLTGTQSANKVLRSDGTNALLSSLLAADIPVLTLAQLPPGSVFEVECTDGTNWVYNGSTVTTRPTSRTDIRMYAWTTGTTAPSFALTGDKLFKIGT